MAVLVDDAGVLQHADRVDELLLRLLLRHGRAPGWAAKLRRVRAEAQCVPPSPLAVSAGPAPQAI